MKKRIWTVREFCNTKGTISLHNGYSSTLGEYSFLCFGNCAVSFMERTKYLSLEQIKNNQDYLFIEENIDEETGAIYYLLVSENTMLEDDIFEQQLAKRLIITTENK